MMTQPQDIPELLAAQVHAMPTGLAVRDETTTLTWSGLADRVGRWSGMLAGHGLRAGDSVALMLGNRVETVEALLACLHSGITVVPINWHLTVPEVAYQLSDSGCRALVVDPARLEVGAKAAAELSTDPVLLVTGTRSGLGCLAVEPQLAAVTSRFLSGQSCGQLMLYTSGTTGQPKGVLNGLFVAGAPFDRVPRLLDYASRVLGVPADGRVLLVGPWYHSAQLFFALLPLLNGASLVIRDRFEPAETLRALAEEQITECHLVPTQFIRLLRLDERTRSAFDPSLLRLIWHGGAACPVPVKRQMIDWWGPVLVEYYAATEGGVVTLVDSEHWLRRPGTVGQAVPPNQLLIVDDDGDELPAGRVGRVFVHRPGRGFSYHNAEEKTRAAHLRPGVFTYGELGYLDPDGYLFLTGRAQDMIITGGVNVYPAEVEAVLLRHPAVRDAAVVGVADSEFGERVAALVELTEPALAPPWPALDAHCRGSLAGFKVPRQYQAVARLPREPTGKVRKDQLRALMASPGEQVGESAWR